MAPISFTFIVFSAALQSTSVDRPMLAMCWAQDPYLCERCERGLHQYRHTAINRWQRRCC